ncbi:hypothetical protein SUNI508_12953 [Seiridium unicorne]|uniref:F-box domain-containing protein n=1 Tax=Seiridium unicorne TaxID=138068 RepID=A0ABR2VF12_9PEZI
MAITLPCCHGGNPKYGTDGVSEMLALPLPPTQSRLLETAIQAKIREYMLTRFGSRREGSSWLYRLPQEIIDKIAHHLTYKDLLRLQVLSKTLQRIIDPQLASEESKISLVLCAEKDYKRHFSKGSVRLGCFICYRVIDLREFAYEQMARDPNTELLPGEPPRYLRRFCISCGLKKGYHLPGTILERRDFTTCWICKCRQIRHKETTLVCDQCKMNMPFRKSVGEIEWFDIRAT